MVNKKQGFLSQITIFITTILLKLTTQAPTPTAGTTTFTSTAPSQFKKFSISKSKFAALTIDSKLYLSPLTGQTTPQIISLNTTQVDSSKTYVGSISCYTNDDTCVVCGQGGCITFTYFANGSYNYLKHYNHNRFNFTNSAGALIKDYVYDVQAIDFTTYFFTIESMKGTNSSGLLRYNSNSLSCYNQFSAKLADDQGREYHLEFLKFTRNIAVSSPATKNIWIFNIQTLVAPLVTITFNDASGHVGSIAGINTQPELMHLISCSHDDKKKACTVIDYSKPAMTVIKVIDISSVSTTAAGINQVKVTSYPQSDFVAIAWNTEIIIASAKNGDNYVSKVQNLAITSVHQIRADFHYADIYILTDSTLIPYKLKEDDAQKKCHEGCLPQGTENATPRCGNDHYQSAGCIAGKCLAGYTTLSPMTCYKTPTVAIPLGGLISTPNLALPFITTGEICTNQTIVANNTTNATSNGTGPFANVAVTPMNSGMRIFWIIFLSLLVFLAVGVGFVLLGMRNGTGKEKKFLRNSSMGMGYQGIGMNPYGLYGDGQGMSMGMAGAQVNRNMAMNGF